MSYKNLENFKRQLECSRVRAPWIWVPLGCDSYLSKWCKQTLLSFTAVVKGCRKFSGPGVGLWIGRHIFDVLIHFWHETYPNLLSTCCTNLDRLGYSENIIKTQSVHIRHVSIWNISIFKQINEIKFNPERAIKILFIDFWRECKGSRQ